MSVVIQTERCTGCRSCEIACSYHHKKVFSRSLSSIEIIRHEKEGKFEILLHQRRKNGHIPCEGCEFCLKYCPEVARDELRAVIAGEAAEKRKETPE